MATQTYSYSTYLVSPTPHNRKPLTFREIEMRSYGLTFPPSDNRFCVPTATPVSLRSTIPINYPTRIFTGFGSLKARATLNSGNVATEEAPQLSFYELLGIPLSGSITEIKQAYKQMARKYHPDVSPPGRVEEYTKLFIQVQEAYETLSDPRRRAMYDRDMARGIHLAFTARTRYHDDDYVCYTSFFFLFFEGFSGLLFDQN